MPRFFLTGGSSIAGGTAFILGEDAAHAKVLRLRVGDHMVVCDGGQDHHCTITRITPQEVEAEIDEVVPCRGEPSVRTLILCGLPKGDKADYIVQKCTEAGAAEIWFFQSQRCVARFPSDPEKKAARWQRIAEEAAKQSGRGEIPRVGLLEEIGAAFNKAKETDLPLFMYETGDRKPLKETLEAAGEIRSAAILTGPEGGFENYEAELAAMMGLRICSMGPRIFRCETAPVAALAAVMYATGNM